VGNIAAVGAVFAAAVSVSGERVPAACAGKLIDRPAVDPVRVFCPPFLAACSAAEDAPLFLFLLHKRPAALPASVRRIERFALREQKTVPAAKALHGIFGDPKLPADVGITEPLSAKAYDFLFLFVVHKFHLLQVAHAGDET